MTSARDLLRWSPRLLGIAVALYLAVFALDAFGEGQGFGAALPGVLVHLLPTAAVLAVVALAWRRAWIGALGFLALATGYAALALGRPTWVLAIAGPLALVGVLYLAGCVWPHPRARGG